MRYRLFAKTAKCFILSYLAVSSVGVLGLEPRMTGPESVVLPLHHTPMVISRNAGAKVVLFLELPKLFGDFFIKTPNFP